MNLEHALAGISGILVTPLDGEDQIAPDRLKPVIDRALNAGVHALTINGNTSEFYALRDTEAEHMVRVAAEAIDGRAPLIGGVGRSVGAASDLARASVAAGASALMIHQTPDPFVSPRGFADYVSRVAEAADGTPLLLYLRNEAIGTAAISDLCNIEGVRGVKWASPTPLKLLEAKAASPDHIIWICGLAEVWAPSLYAVGARGFTSGLINVWPERSVAIHAALDAGDYDAANKLIAGMRVFEDIRAEEMNGANVSVVKAALQMMGDDCGASRPPSCWPLTDRQTERLSSFLSRNALMN